MTAPSQPPASSVNPPSPLLKVGRSGPLTGTCRVPGDKSISHRALLFGALCDGVVEVSGLGVGGDNVSTARAMSALGVPLTLSGDRARIQGLGFAGLRASSAPLDCGNSGTSIRLLLGLLAGRPFESVLHGDASLSRRPMGRVARPLQQMGATLEGRAQSERPGEIYPPVRVRGGQLSGIRYELPVASAQLKSALILAGLQARGPTELVEPELSRDHSERMLAHLGAPIRAFPQERRVLVEPDGWDGRLRAGPMLVPGDLSSAAFILVAAALVPGSDVTIENVGLNPTRTGVLDVLTAMGADLQVTSGDLAMGEPVGAIRIRHRPLRATAVSGALAVRAIDEIPALAVAAAAAQGSSHFSDLRELRVKESDRIVSIARELGRAGVRVDEEPEGFVVHGLQGRAPVGGTVRPDHDHRIAMAGAVLGLLSDQESLVPEEDIATSFPSFASTLRALGANLYATQRKLESKAGAEQGPAGDRGQADRGLLGVAVAQDQQHGVGHRGGGRHPEQGVRPVGTGFGRVAILDGALVVGRAPACGIRPSSSGHPGSGRCRLPGPPLRLHPPPTLRG